jgi:hypothetical protein
LLDELVGVMVAVSPVMSVALPLLVEKDAEEKP